MDEHWSTVTLAADTAAPHDESIRWIAARSDTGIERVRVVGLDPALEARGTFDTIVAAVGAALPGIAVEPVRHAGAFSTAILDEAAHGDLLVIGAFRSRRGSTVGRDPARIAERAPVPTVVVPDGPHPIEGDVVLTVDEPLDERALSIVLTEAARLHRRVTLLRAWEMPVMTRTGLTDFAEDPGRWRRANEEALRRVTADVQQRHPEARAHPLLVEGRPGKAIAAHTGRASLVVVGRGHVRVLSGSVLHDLLHDTRSPVLVVPPTAH